ncbi:PTS family fructose mannitol porter component IIA [Companilactobacillus paralimentarius DSM 13238 = JCM 10415]|jgi:Phosphotransferase system mannitol/fructose-specific IIA domain (Ntr-type)|uniref:PTS family fructose mannitol porter component IIA n=1 Tax=Companilactobacillus paralimentarius DSM 13238 = JCM 10415 TaxID=1122151 RepID=A0A0R1PGI3_9LACO|nr:PTS sugar transporter subunit IIA [Companilactobacillus paralimentarius]KAE9565406.1 PTS sugar transporter subunit IIA [Companilactobacillus paralimentarius]KRL31536.1 PTS family fructose mannitol porter component IIA [Companilactobacillus paralimentarius DSM 13238 = JCM 10415]MDR4933030.1 PTS sugar transporter subunit IIA [Companilactobacillus paralimentarius]QFR69564.1 PTS sugar transporter subunit IIA [Companilactobacillus paralimentarius]
MFDEEIVLLDITPKDSTEALSIVSDELIKKNVVKESYKDAIIKREEEFPTGLNAPSCGIAIPHTDAIHVNKPQIAIARLAQPVKFLQMGDGADVEAKLIFMLALKEPHAQLETLQKLMALIQNETAVAELIAAKDSKTVINVLKENDL